jgi:hypothetical protein
LVWGAIEGESEKGVERVVKRCFGVGYVVEGKLAGREIRVT